MVVQLENYDKQIQIITLLKEENTELQKKIDKLNEIVRLQELRITNAENTIDQLNKIIEDQKVAYEKQIDEVKPKLSDKLSWGAKGFGFGSVLAIIGVLALGVL